MFFKKILKDIQKNLYIFFTQSRSDTLFFSKSLIIQVVCLYCEFCLLTTYGSRMLMRIPYSLDLSDCYMYK